MLRLVSKIHDLSINPVLERGSADDLLARCRRRRRNKGSRVDRKDRLHNKTHWAQKVKFLKYFRVEHERFSFFLYSLPHSLSSSSESMDFRARILLHDTRALRNSHLSLERSQNGAIERRKWRLDGSISDVIRPIDWHSIDTSIVCYAMCYVKTFER